jgi:hypothetical protein
VRELDKSGLMQIKNIKREIELLKKDIEDYQPHTVTDSVKGSSRYFPFQARSFAITGVDTEGYDKRVKRLRNQLKRRISDLMDKVEKAQEYIAGIEDSRTRIILQCRYINGLTWESIEDETGIPERTAKRIYHDWQMRKTPTTL